MNSTDYQAKYLAYELTRRCPSDSIEKLAAAVAGAQVDLNPHQVDAALFAFQSPLSKGAILADEVGLGKTIEAGLVISQRWAERKRRILVITPSNLRKQWHQELTEKFFLPCEILESKFYNAAIKKGHFQPFEPAQDAVVICSYQFARAKASDVRRTPWDLVVIDEAHRLRNEHNAKGKALIKALEVAFAKAKELGAAEKAIIFTESRKTQSYLLRLLADTAYAEGIVLFNGTNSDDTSKAIYQQCRKPEEVKVAFDQLQLELSFEINEAMTDTRRKLLENFDDEVRDKLKIRDDASRACLNRFERQLIQLTRHEMNGHAEFPTDSSFILHTSPFPGIPLGRYELPRRTGEAHFYRLGHPLAENIIGQAKSRDLPPAEIEFRYADHGSKISILEPLRGLSGWLTLSLFSVEAMDQAEDYLIFAACADDESLLTDDQARRLLNLPATVSANGILPALCPPLLSVVAQDNQSDIRRHISQRNAQFYEAEAEKLDGWADGLKVGLEREIKEMDRLIKEARRAAVTALTLEEKLAGQRQVKAIESQRNDKRRSLFAAQDAIDSQREELIGKIEGKLQHYTANRTLFTIRWHLN